MALALLTHLKARLGIDGTSQDAVLGQALSGAGAMLNSFCGRVLEYVDGDATEQFDGGGWDVKVPRFPVVGAPVIKVAPHYDFAGAAALTAGTDYVVDAVRGILSRLPDGARWPAGRRIIQVVYRGGYVDPATTPLPNGTQYVPAHLREAALLTAVDLYRRRDEPGYKVVWSAGEVSGGFAPAVELLPAVKALLRGEVR